MPAYDKSVFINCPYDAAFAELFHAIILTVVARGFRPRSAIETSGEAEPRISRIAKGLSESKYSIHDLSRLQGEGPDNLARFNMPLELGMALGIRHLRSISGDGLHNWMVLVPGNFVHHKAVSDLAGYDLYDHDSQPAGVIRGVSTWLSLQPDAVPETPPAKVILGAVPAYRDLLARAKADALGVLSWPVMVAGAEVMVEGLP